MTQMPLARPVGASLSPRWLLGLAVLAVLGGAACTASGEPSEVATIGFAQEADDRPIEEKIDTNGDGETSEEEIEAYAQQTFLEFSQCMRDSGFEDFTDLTLEDFTDSGEDPDFLGLMAERGVALSDPEALTALQECGSELQQLQTFAPQPSDAEVAEQEAQLLDFAACMREQGITDWPDPDFATSPNGYGPEIAQEFDLNSSTIQEAGQACQADGRGFAVEAPDETPEPSPAAGADDEEGEPNEAIEGEPADERREAISGLIVGDTADLNSAEVTRRDLVQTEALSGTLGFGDLRPFPTNSTGIVTWLPEEGDIIDIGDTVFEIDNIPVLMMEGEIPQYRGFEINMTDGLDVEQLEQNLEALGYVVDRDLTVDDDFTSVTRDVIRDMQEEMGVDDTGTLELGTVVFTEGPIRVGRVNVELGQSINPQVNVLDVTDVDQAITLELVAEDRSLLAEGDSVDIEMPDGTVVAGTIDEIADVATQQINPQTGTSGDPTITVTATFSGAPPAGTFDAAPVEVIVTTEVAEQVLTVPVPALIALAGGGHAVELIVDGGTQLIAVELGDFVDDFVEVDGNLREGDLVVMAAS